MILTNYWHSYLKHGKTTDLNSVNIQLNIFQTGTDKKGLPKIINVEEGGVKKLGKTKFTDGQLTQVVEHRKGIVAKFLDSNASWHCLFTTFNSLIGTESWKGGQPHFHYISDKFGLTRDQVINELKNKNYKLGSLPHIDLLK